MGALRQLWLPKLRRVAKVKRIRKSPEPITGEYKTIKQYEIFHRPFDLRFRGRINGWLNLIKAQKMFKLNEILDPDQLKVVKLYFFPQKTDNAWLTQSQVLEKIDKKSKKKLRAKLVSSLIRIWKADKE